MEGKLKDSSIHWPDLMDDIPKGSHSCILSDHSISQSQHSWMNLMEGRLKDAIIHWSYLMDEILKVTFMHLK